MWLRGGVGCPARLPQLWLVRAETSVGPWGGAFFEVLWGHQKGASHRLQHQQGLGGVGQSWIR